MIRRNNYIFLLVLFIASGMRVTSSSIANMSYLVIACHTLLGRQQAIQAGVYHGWLMGSLGILALAIVITVNTINMGESTLFSPGGLGLLLMILLAWASTSNRGSWSYL